ncbi:MAG: O-antigen ligase family protein [Deltaproteobacteria bacterium]|nr:O-antigen ligase family protein [Deltaproteobacteria bacterium]
MRSLISTILFLLVALLTGYFITQYPPSTMLMGMLALIIFTISFVNIEWGLYILIFSMLLSPEIIIGETGGASLGRGVTLRVEDFLLAVIGLSWFARNAVRKELGLFLKTPLNKAILFYVLTCVISTGFGIISGRVELKTGTLFVLKYLEYFIVFFMMVNHVRNTDQVKRFVFCLFLTCFIASIIGIFQIPGGGRVSAPFEGDIGEPNTFGGYLLFIGIVAAGLLAKTDNPKTKQILTILIICIIPSFLFTESRSSYLALVPALMVLGFMTDRRAIILGVLLLSLLASPLFLPTSVKTRIMFTFTQPEERGQIQIGDLRLDTSTSARLVSWKETLQDFPEQPLLGYGVTGYSFVDAQYPRVLVETGILGVIAFLYLLFSILKVTLDNLKKVKTPYFQGLAVGFLAGFVGLIVHSLGANTFIIVRIMEPFWFFAGIVVVMPAMERQQTEQAEVIVPRGKALVSGT